MAEEWPIFLSSLACSCQDLTQKQPSEPFPTTKIKYQISEFSYVTLKVYDVLGKEIRTLVSEEKPAGRYEVEFNATSLPSGIYFYKLEAGDFVETKKMILMKQLHHVKM